MDHLHILLRSGYFSIRIATTLELRGSRPCYFLLDTMKVNMCVPDESGNIQRNPPPSPIVIHCFPNTFLVSLFPAGLIGKTTTPGEEEGGRRRKKAD